MSARIVRLSEERAALSAESRGGSVVLVGNFDGVHRGHRAVILDAVDRGRCAELPIYVLTFDPHPRAVLTGSGPPVLTTLARRAELLGRLGVDKVLVQHFDRAFAAWSPERFVTELLVGALHARDVGVGNNFRFGAHRAGDLALLKHLGETEGLVARGHSPEGDDAGPFSSSRARDAVARGDLAAARAVLGRPHAISGVVVHGHKLGRTLGFPTANLGNIPELTPPDGIYAVVVDRLHAGVPRALAKGVMSIGLRPTIEGAVGRTHEVFLFDFDEDIYGAELRVHLVARQRDELRFDGLDALKAQMHKDVNAARALVASVDPEDGVFG